MTPRTARWIAWALVIAYVVTVGAGLFFLVLARRISVDLGFPIILYILVILVVMIWPVIGARIVTHHPRHPVGWLLFATFPLGALDIFSIGYASYAIHTSLDVSAIPGAVLLWLNWSAQSFVLVTFTLMSLVFPTGKFLSRRWRVIAWTVVAALPIYLGLEAVAPGPLVFAPMLDNPYAVGDSVWTALSPFYFAVITLLLLCNLAALASLFLRLRRAQRDERQQVKWLLFPAIVYWISQPFGFLVEYDPSGISLTLAGALVLISIPAMVIAVAFAIFKYRLYDVDLIINRTLVYGALTACVVGLYVLLVGGAGLVVQADLNLAGLVITAGLAAFLFRPMRAFFQGGVDRLMFGPAGGLPSAPGDERPAPAAVPGPALAAAPRAPLNRLSLARLAWWLAFAVAAGAFITSLADLLIDGPAAIGYPFSSASHSPWMLFLAWMLKGTALAVGALSLSLALLLFRRRSGDRIALFTSFFLLAHGVLLPEPFAVLEPLFPELASFGVALIQVAVVFLTLFLFAVFPDGRFVPPWTRWVVLAALLAAPFATYWNLLLTRSQLEFSRPLVLAAGGAIIALTAGLWIAILYAQVYRYRHSATPQQRQQIKWVVFGLGIWFGYQLIAAVPWTYASSLPPGAPLPGWLAISSLLYILSIAILPVTLTIAVTRHQLFDIDLIINRTLVYGALTASVVTLYVLIVGGAGLIVQTDLNLAGLVITALLVAGVFRPMRGLYQRGADRLLPVQNKAPPDASIPLAPRIRTPPPSAQAAPDDAAPPPGLDWLRAARLAWYPAFASALAILAASVTGVLVIGSGDFLIARFSLNPSPWITAIGWIAIAAGFATALLSILLALLLYRRRPADRMALFTSFFLLLHGVIVAGPTEALEPLIPGIAAVTQNVLIPAVAPVTLFLFAVFPDGRFVPRWTRWLVLAAFLAMPFSFYWTAWIVPGSLDFSQPADLIGAGLLLLLAVAIWLGTLYAQIHRYRHVSSPEQRQQTKWVIYGIGLWFTTQVISGIPWMMSYSLPAGAPLPFWLLAAAPVWSVSVAILPVTLTISVLRYRLFEVDFLINRTLVYGGLTGSVVLIYILLVGTLGVLFQTQGNLVVALLATGVVAALFQPLRARLQQAANRLLYGERDNPLAVMSNLARRLEAAVSPEAMLVDLVRTVGQTLKLPHVAITAGEAERERLIATWGQRQGAAHEFQLVYGAETIGHLRVCPRSPGEAFAESERALLQNIAGQASALVQAVRLTSDLQQSHARLVAAREEERRRLRRDLHDGLGASLAALHLQTGMLRRMIRDDAPAAEGMIDEFREELGAAIDDIRRVVYALRPPALDDLGLVPAIRAQAARCAHAEEADIGAADQPPRPALNVRVEAPGEMPPLPAAVEVAAFRIVQEALTNVVRHAQARRCIVRLQLADVLHVEVVDDGVGVAERHRSGIGLVSMRERAAELGGLCTIGRAPGGGTRVAARLPLPRE